MIRKLKIILLLVFVPFLAARGQFYVPDTEPGYLKWKNIETPTYRIVYPEGLDSLAREYAVSLEHFRTISGRGSGYVPNQMYRRRFPVILRACTAYSNGMVAWTPRRMELLTVPEAYSPEPTPWIEQLTLHESRHVAQMQFTRDGWMKPVSWLTGELFSGAAAALYADPAFLEGDAVMAETALSTTGRGRTADFLEYYYLSFDQGECRNFWKWRYGSLKKYSPDHYALGYLTTAGTRVLYNEPDFTERYFRRMFRRKIFYPLFNYPKTVKEISGKKFRKAFREIEDTAAGKWRADADKRAPYTPERSVTAPRSYWSEYTGNTVVGDTLYSVRKSSDRGTELVRTGKDGRQKHVRFFSSQTSRPVADPSYGRIYWSEYRPDIRWGMLSFSAIRYLDSKGKVHELNGSSRMYNPCPRGEEVATVEYLTDGSCHVTVLSAADGSVLRRYTAPAGYQPVEPVWAGGVLYVSCISAEGFGIYRAEDYSAVLGAAKVKIKQLFSRDGKIYFTSDRDGVNNLYRFDPVSGELVQQTSARYGMSDFAFTEGGDSLYVSVPGLKQRGIHVVAAADLMEKPVSLQEITAQPFAEELCAQEAGRPSGHPSGKAEATPSESFPEELDKVSAPRPYSRFAHLFKIHSWLPVYVDYSDVESISAETVSSSAGSGVTLFTQNDLGTLSGSVGYLAHDGSGWKHEFHSRLVWTGSYPVVETSLDYGERPSINYFYSRVPSANGREQYLSASYLSSKRLAATIHAYIPFNFSSGGWTRGLIPRARLNISNDLFSRPTGEISPMSSMSLSLRAYSVLPTGSARYYPLWGAGVEMGTSFHPGVSDIMGSSAYAFAYGYLPGLAPAHGIRLSAEYDTPLSGGGKEDYFRLTADYALPFLDLQWSGLCPAFYVRNLEFVAHAEGGSFPLKAGGSLVARLGNFLFIPYDTRLGVSYIYDTDRTIDSSGFSMVFSIGF